MRAARAILVAAAGVVCAAWVFAGGCSRGPTPTRTDIDPDLAKIAAVYAATVEGLHRRRGETWYHGWHGNILPNTLGETFGQKGLCYQWQEEVWRGVQPALKETGWRGVGIAANVGHWTEHHVVAVYDPVRIGREEILTRASPRPVWVLDPWHTGRAEVYTLEEWLVRGTAEWYSVVIEALETPAKPGNRAERTMERAR